MEIKPEVQVQLLTMLVWFLAIPAVCFVVYLLWRKFGPSRRHRRHSSRLRRYLGETRAQKVESRK